MALFPRQVSSLRPVPGLGRAPGSAPPRRRLPVGLALLVAATCLLAACGMRVQTNLPYTPADGVNFDIGQVAVRNLLITSKQPGEGYLSATLVAKEADALQAVAGTAIKPDGSDGAPITASLSAPVPLEAGEEVVLTDQAVIVLRSADLRAGLTASLTLRFQRAGETTVRVPVMDGNLPEYATITPSPAPTPSPTPSG